MRILVVDDNPDAAVVVENFLKALDHKVYSYTDPREALLWIKDVKPQLIFADLDMPEMNGYEFVKRLRGYSAYVNVPVICVTGTDALDEEIKAGGFQQILRKPFTLSDMMLAIEEVEASLNLTAEAG
jgi:CheY-like chemotaxis protein